MSSLKTQNTAINNFLTSTMSNEVKEAFIQLLELNVKGRDDITFFSKNILGMPLNDFQNKFLTRTTTPRSKWKEVFSDNNDDEEDIEDIGGMLYGKNIAYPSNQVGKLLNISG